MNKLLILLLALVAVLSQDKQEKAVATVFDIDKAEISAILIRKCFVACPLGHICIAGRCIPIFIGCPRIRCPFGYICLLGRCIRLPIFYPTPCLGRGCDTPYFPFLKEELEGVIPDIKELNIDF